MEKFGDFHTHTVLCDGKNTAQEMVCAAIARGLPVFGISGHMPITCYPNDWSMPQDKMSDYVSTLQRLRRTYEEQITLLIGLEADTHGYLSPFFELDDKQNATPLQSAFETSNNGNIAAFAPFDYCIGSVHSVLHDGEYIEVDGDAQTVRHAIDTHFGGDGVAYACAYFEACLQIAKLPRCTFVGHFDVVTKFNERFPMIDTTHHAYRAAAHDAMAVLAQKIGVMEINTGAITRGWLSHPYPDLPLLRDWRQMGGEIILSSDAHGTDQIAASFNTGAAWARAAGFHQALTLDKDGFHPYSLEA